MQVIFQGLTAFIAVFISFCRGAQRYAEAFEATGTIAHRIATVGDKHVEQWEIEQDAKIAEAKRKALLAANQVQAQD